MNEVIDGKKRKKMLSIIKNLQKKMKQLAKMRKSIEVGKKTSARHAQTLIEEIHVPALQVLKEKSKRVH